MSEADPKAEHFDIFLCHNSEDKPEICQIADELSRRGINIWLDEREILPGQQWQVALEEQIQTIKAAAVFVGKSGISPWQKMEIRTLIDQFVKRACPVIPVILSSATETPELPIFLQNFHWVDFRQNHPDPYERLISGIAGKKSDHEREKVSASVLLELSQDDAERRLHPPIANPPDQKQQEQLGILRDRVQEYWVDGVLRQSLYHEVLILLGKRTMDEVVERPPWKYDVVDLPDRCRNILPQDYTINTVFDATGLLLILGEPGSGKTTSLLELAAVLINRAKDDPKERVPIVLNLSSWQKTQSLEEWIAVELSTKYRIPVKIAKVWLANGYLVPLLDGLDEVQPANQPDCVATINTFIDGNSPSGMVVCSRLMEYQWLPRKLKLSGAVCLEPLSGDDVNNFLIAGGAQLAGLQQAMNSDSVLQELAKTPLMLSIMSLACEGADGKALASRKEDSPQVRREHIFELYVDRMFQRKKAITSSFSQDEVIGWLSWLARKMKEQSQSVFLVEELQPMWLNSKGQRWAYEAVAALSVGLLGWLVSVVLATGLVLGLFGSLEVGEFVLSGELNDGISKGLIRALFVGVSIFLGCRSTSVVKNGVLSGIFGWLLGAWLGTATSENIIESGLSLAFSCGLIGGFGIGLWGEIRLVETMRWQQKQFVKKAALGMIVGLILGLAIGPSIVLRYGRSSELELILFVGLAGGLFLGLVFALILGLIVGLMGGLADGALKDKVHPNQGIISSLKSGFSACLLGWLTSGLMIGPLLWLLSDPKAELLSWIAITLGAGVSLGLLLGLNRGGSAVVKHYALRLVLWLIGCTPPLSRFIPFLDHCAKLILLKKVGGGYMFIHRTLLEYFAALPTAAHGAPKENPQGITS